MARSRTSRPNLFPPGKNFRASGLPHAIPRHEERLAAAGADQGASYFADRMAFTTGPVELDRMRRASVIMVIADVRESEDFAKGHIPGAINLPRRFWAKPEGLHKDKTTVLCCYSEVCHLAAAAAVQLAGQGYPVMEMEGGMAAWRENHLEIETS